MAQRKKTTDFKRLKKKLSKKQNKIVKQFENKFPQAQEFLEEKGIELDKVRGKSAQLITLSALATTMMLAQPTESKGLPIPKEILEKLKGEKDYSSDPNTNQFIVDVLKELLPLKARPLNADEEKYLENLFKNFAGIPAKATLEGQHLNTTYGYIGAEQHLRRYPGDILANHGTIEIQRSGIAPGRGAWGYFANSKSAMTRNLEQTERWYAVVQTMYLPEWNTNTAFLREWYRYRKVLIVNTQNGNSVVSSIADAGPAAWTGKHFGGSPEVMLALGGPKYKKGAVIIFFVDDPENKIPLGPVAYNQKAVSTFAMKYLTPNN
jgi:hypothetical protein